MLKLSYYLLLLTQPQYVSSFISQCVRISVLGYTPLAFIEKAV
jgi:hypothetical protein